MENKTTNQYDCNGELLQDGDDILYTTDIGDEPAYIKLMSGQYYAIGVGTACFQYKITDFKRISKV